MVTLPANSSVPAIHFLRAVCGSIDEWKKVARAPSSNRLRGCSWRPSQMIISAPALVAICPAANLVAIPPEAKEAFALPPIARIASVISFTSPICVAFGSSDGSVLYNPSISDNKITRSAEIMPATRAASLSLSPNLIS